MLCYYHRMFQVAESQSAHLSSIQQQLLNCDSGHMTLEQMEVHAHAHAEASSSFTPETPATGGDKEQSAPVMYSKEEAFLGKTSSCFEEDRKSAAAAVAAKLAASTSSAQMLSYVFSSLASESVDGNSKGGSSDAVPFEKRPKRENVPFSYFPPQHHPQQPPLPPFPHPDSLQNKASLATSQQMRPPQQQPPPQPSPPDPPMHQSAPPPPSFIQTAGSMIGPPYSFSPIPLPGFSMPRTPLTAVPPYPSPPAPYQSLQGPEGGFFSQPAIPATPPISRS